MQKIKGVCTVELLTRGRRLAKMVLFGSTVVVCDEEPDVKGATGAIRPARAWEE